MALVVEDGTGLANADAYASEAFVTAWHAGLGRTDWAAFTADQKDQSIRRATFYIDSRFGRVFRGHRSSSSQALEWPRFSAWDDEGMPLDAVPVALQRAVAEYALQAARRGELAPLPPSAVPGQTAAGVSSAATGEVASETKTVGPLSISKEYRAPSESSSRRDGVSQLVDAGHLVEYPAADLWMEELIKGPGVELVRG